jgi:hypothetical protein
MKPGYQCEDPLRSFAERNMGKAEMQGSYAKGGKVKAKCMAMGGAGKMRKNQSKRGPKKG